MSIEIPVLRLGLAGLTESQQKAASEAVRAAATPRAGWEIGAFAEADAWWLEGSRTVVMANQHLRVQPAVPNGRSVQLALADVDRPVGFTLPLAAPGFRPAVTFPIEDRGAAVGVLNRFTEWLQPMLSQFALAASIADHQPSLASGSWEVIRQGDLLAVVDLKLGAGVMPGATPEHFAEASWCIRDYGAVTIPASYPRVSVSQLMWQFAQRTQRDLLPPHYRTQSLFFRRPPRLSQRLLKDAHLLLMRELVMQPGLTFRGLQQCTGLGEGPLARCLSALYVVGSITANPKRATGAPITVGGSRDSDLASPSIPFGAADSGSAAATFVRAQQRDMTAPAPLRPE